MNLRIGSVSVSATVAVLLAATHVVGDAHRLPPLSDILDTLARVAAVYEGNALRFTAEEVTRVNNNLGVDSRTRRSMTLVNVYFYYRNDSGVLLDRRIRKSDMRKLEKAASADEFIEQSAQLGDPMSDIYGQSTRHVVPAYLERPYSWILLFAKSNRARHNFTVEAADLPGRVRVRFTPRNPGDADAWYGHAEVSLDSYQIVHAEGMEAIDYQAQRKMRAMFASDEDAPLDDTERTFIVRRVATEFDVVERGLRFPSRVELIIDRHRVSGAADSKKVKTMRASKIIQTYKKYRFFDVEVEADFLAVAPGETGEPQ